MKITSACETDRTFSVTRHVVSQTHVGDSARITRGTEYEERPDEDDI